MVGVTELKLFNEVAFNAARGARVDGKVPHGMALIVYNEKGDYSIVAEGCFTHELIGVMQRCCYKLHEVAEKP